MAVTAALSIQDVYGSRAGAAPRVTARATPGATRQGTPASQAQGVSPRLAGVLSQSSPVYGIVVVVVLLLGLRFLAHKAGGPEELKSVKISPWNAVVITLMAMLGFFLLKISQILFPIPHVANVIMGA